MHYLIYKITNKIDGKIYIGQHMTNDLNDGYMGSGVALGEAQIAHGIKNFDKEILHYCSTAQEMNLKEQELVTMEFIKRDDTYNLVPGGQGGNKFIGEHRKDALEKQKEYGRQGADITNKIIKDTPDKDALIKLTEKSRAAILIKYPNGTSGNFKHKNENLVKALKNAQTNEAREKRIESLSTINHQRGNINSQYDTCWIYNLDLKQSKKINKIDLDDWLSVGWLKGRKLTFNTITCQCGNIFVQKIGETFCSVDCRKKYSYENKLQITEYEKKELFVKYYKEFNCKSVALKKMGYPGNVGAHCKWATKVLSEYNLVSS